MIALFKDIAEKQWAQAGGKAASLCKLIKNGVPVPEGFVVFGQNRKMSGKASYREILAHFKKLGALHVAVRSSANCEDGEHDSFAGQFETFLYVDAVVSR